MEEFGACTTPRGEPPSTWQWDSYGQARRQFMASEAQLADYIEQVLPRLVEVGALGALLWCFADYHEELYRFPPCDEAWHERTFGLVRPDGSLKPHAAVLRRSAESDRWSGLQTSACAGPHPGRVLSRSVRQRPSRLPIFHRQGPRGSAGPARY
jgi:hypothetical protein